MVGDELAERLNKLKEDFVEKEGREAYEEMEKRYIDGDIDNKIDFKAAKKLIEELESEMNSK